jgi:hypothetical protein
MEQTAVQTHTPGPWKTITLDNEVYINPDRGADEYALLARVSINHPASEGNARLIAAAPELLEALELAHKALSEESRYAQSTTANKIRAAIRKATGE